MCYISPPKMLVYSQFYLSWFIHLQVIFKVKLNDPVVNSWNTSLLFNFLFFFVFCSYIIVKPPMHGKLKCLCSYIYHSVQWKNITSQNDMKLTKQRMGLLKSHSA